MVTALLYRQRKHCLGVNDCELLLSRVRNSEAMNGGTCLDVTIPGVASPISGTEAIVIFGANGSGKTRLAIEISRNAGGEFVPALRNVAMPDQLPNWTRDTASREFDNRINGQIHRHWDLNSDIDALFAKLMSEHAAEAVRVHDEITEGRPIPTLIETALQRIKKIWRQVFPGRSIRFSDFSARVSSEHIGEQEYAASQMSDGERTGLYLAARVLNSNRTLVLIDEPETHFHSRLAVRFWDAMEAACPDKRFVYVTHDLAFALSRIRSPKVLVRPGQPPAIIPAGSTLPDSDLQAVLGAASFSIYARRIVFCEGREERSLDQALLRAWFNDRGTALVPVGSCESVRRCVASFRDNPIVGGFDAVGLIDRDHFPDDLIGHTSGLSILDVHEVESLYVLPEVFSSVAAHLGKTAEAASLYAQALGEMKRSTSGVIEEKLVEQRYKARYRAELERAVFAARAERSASVEDHATHSSQAIASIDARAIAVAERAMVRDALNSADAIVFLRIAPGKGLIHIAARVLGMTKESYCELVQSALESPPESELGRIGRQIQGALAPHLPPRTS